MNERKLKQKKGKEKREKRFDGRIWSANLWKWTFLWSSSRPCIMYQPSGFDQKPTWAYRNWCWSIQLCNILACLRPQRVFILSRWLWKPLHCRFMATQFDWCISLPALMLFFVFFPFSSFFLFFFFFFSYSFYTFSCFGNQYVPA